jgi:hypothetical protein
MKACRRWGHEPDHIANNPNAFGVRFHDRPTERQPHVFILIVDHHVVSVAPGADQLRLR